MQVKLKAGILWCEKLVSFFLDDERGWKKKENTALTTKSMRCHSK
jgi:hypothetical protein